MAIANQKLIDILEKTIILLQSTEQYQWGHSGACNCGHIAQVITGYNKGQIHAMAMEKGGDWTENSRDYCDTSGYEIDQVMKIMLESGLQIEDIREIENLSNPRILDNITGSIQYLDKNKKENVLLYFQTWLMLLKADLKNSSYWVPGQIALEEVPIYDSLPV